MTVLLFPQFFTTSPVVLEVCIVAAQQGGDVQSVGTTRLAQPAVDALIDDLHLFFKLIREVYAEWGAAQEERHPVAVVD